MLLARWRAAIGRDGQRARHRHQGGAEDPDGRRRGAITVEDQNGNAITFDSSGLSVKGGGQSVELGSSGVSVNQGALEIT